MVLLNILEKVAPFVVPPGKDADEERIQHYRILMSLFLVGTILMFAWFLGASPWSEGVAFADDVEVRIEAALEPVTERLTAIETEQTVQSGYLKSLVKSDLRDQIDRMVRSRCELNATDDQDDDVAKDLINDTIANYQEQFEKVAGEDYNEPECTDL